MPGSMRGDELAQRVAARWPGLKVQLTSGYVGETRRRSTGSTAALPFLAKPYRQADLARAVRKALDS